MIQIKDLLENLKNSLFSEELKKDEIRRIISEEIKVNLKSSDIEIKNGTWEFNYIMQMCGQYLIEKQRSYDNQYN